MRAFASAALRLLPIPFVLLAAALTTLDSRGPFWLGTNSDPSYAYALNSLRLLEGQPPTHLDHPGVTVHLLGAGVFRLSHRVASRSLSESEDVLAHPEWYLAIAVRTLAGFFAVALLLLGLAVWRLTNRWSLAWIAQAGPLLSPSVLFELTDFKPEPVLYLLVVLLAAAIAVAVARGQPDRAALPITLGVLVGLAVATKLTALPLLVGPLVLHRTWRARLACCGSAAIAFLLCAIPALPNWRLAVAFVGRVTIGSGLYGAGPSADRPYFEQWTRIGIEEAPYFLVLAVAVAAVLHGWARRHETVHRAIVALLATSLTQLAIVAKHPYQPRYLVPALGLCGLLLALSLHALRAPGLGLRRPGTPLVAILVIGIAAHQIPRFLRRDAQLREATWCQTRARELAIASGCRVVSFYRGSSPALALFQGDALAGSLFRERLNRLFPTEAFLYVDHDLLGFGGRVELAGLAQQCVVLHGSPGGPGHPFAPLSPHPFDGIPALASARPTWSCGWEAVFRREALPAPGP